MGIEAIVTLATVVLIVVLLGTTRIPPELILLTGLTFLFTVGIVSAKEALAGFTNQGMVTVGVLYLVAAGLRDSGGMDIIAPHVLGTPKSIPTIQVKIMLPVTVMSAFLNNTPVVAMLIPTISDWVKKYQLAISRFLIPLSYAAILGGMCTLIGTSTNLVVNGLLINFARENSLTQWTGGLNLFEIAKIGVPLALVGMAYILVFNRWLLPERQSMLSRLSDPREYTVEMIVEKSGPLINKSIQAAGLRHLPGMYLMEIERAGRVIPAVSSEEILQAHDRLVFVGVVESVVDLRKVRGLAPATDQIFKLNGTKTTQRCLVEAVVSNTFPHLGQTIRESRFRSRYNAAIIAVARNGKRIHKKIGDIILEPGDTLLLETHASFADQQKNSRDFYLVNQLDDSTPPRYEKAGLSLLILLGMVLMAAMGWMSMLKAAMAAAALMILTGCTSWSSARQNIDYQVLMVIIAAFGLGRALDVTGAASTVARGLLGIAGDNPWIALLVVYGLTSLFTELITNNAAAVLIFPIAMETTAQLAVNPLPFIIAIMIGASASFATPIGYQTNLMVYGPGGYKFSDYLKIGIPMNLLMWILTVAIAPLIWPF
jgi:di/tricarboxylate transporter